MNKNKKGKIIKNYTYLIIILVVVLLSSFLIKVKETFVTISSPEWNNVDKTWKTDVTNELITILSKGGDVQIPDGDYLINPSSGTGVIVNLNSSITVKCSKNTKFIAGSNLDSDMIQFTRLSIPTENLTVNWSGGSFYQNNQKNPILLPLINQMGGYPTSKYPPKNQGKSSKNSALSVVSITSGLQGGLYLKDYGIFGCTINNVTCYGSGKKDLNINIDKTIHWENAGGGNGIYIEGVKDLLITQCKLHRPKRKMRQ